MECVMFYTSQTQIHYLKKGILKSGILRSGVPDNDGLPDQDTLKQHCLESASLWVLKRRANLPYVPPRRLPAVARGG
jgi:hypothetical protein